MSALVYGEVIKHSRAEGAAFTVLLIIADISGDDGVALPKWDTTIRNIARKARLAPRTCQYAMRELEKLGELAVHVDPGRRHSNTFQILIDRNHVLFDGPAPVLAARTAEALAKQSARLQDLRDEAEAPVDNLEDATHPVVQTVAPGGRKRRQEKVQTVAPNPSIRHSHQTPHLAPSPEKAVDKKPTAAERVKVWMAAGISPEVRSWARAHGWEAFLDLHREHFADYLAQPAKAAKYVDLDAAFRNCVRADWGDVRMRAQRDAKFGHAVDLTSWWKSPDGINGKGFAIGMPWDPATWRLRFVERVPLDPRGGRQWTAEEIAAYGRREYVVAVLDAVVEREGWGAWVDPERQQQDYEAVCRRRLARGAAMSVKIGENVNAT